MQRFARNTDGRDLIVGDIIQPTTQHANTDT
jgi:hypothetical protein